MNWGKPFDDATVKTARDGEHDRQPAVVRAGGPDQQLYLGLGDCRAVADEITPRLRGGVADGIGLGVSLPRAPAEESAEAAQVFGDGRPCRDGEPRGDESVNVLAGHVAGVDVPDDPGQQADCREVMDARPRPERGQAGGEFVGGCLQRDRDQFAERSQVRAGVELSDPAAGEVLPLESDRVIDAAPVAGVLVVPHVVPGESAATVDTHAAPGVQPGLSSAGHDGYNTPAGAPGQAGERVANGSRKSGDARKSLLSKGRSGGIGRRAGFKRHAPPVAAQKTGHKSRTQRLTARSKGRVYVAQFWGRVARDSPTECWPWIGYIDRDGYGRAGHRLAHRVAYELAVGEFPPELAIDHLCRNRRCCNLAHLEPVTWGENNSRAAAVKTKCKRGHQFGPRSGGGRRCPVCQAANQHAWYIRNKERLAEKQRERRRASA